MMDMDSNKPPSMLDLAGQLGVSDPQVLRLMEALTQQESEPEQNAPELEEQLDELRGLYRENRELREANDFLAGQIETLAAALGACAACWGEEEKCAECDGRGTSGSFVPDKEAFAEYVLPTIRRLRQQAQARRAHRTGSVRATAPEIRAASASPAGTTTTKRRSLRDDPRRAV